MSKYSVRSNFRFKDCTSRSTFSCLVLTAEAFMTSALQKEISGNAIFDLGRRNMDWWKSTSRHKILQEQSFFPEPFDRVEEHQTHRPLLCISRKIESENWSHLVLSSFCTCFRMWYSWPSGQLFRMGKSLSFSPCMVPMSHCSFGCYLHSKKAVLEPLAENLVRPAGHLSFWVGELVIGEARRRQTKRWATRWPILRASGQQLRLSMFTDTGCLIRMLHLHMPTDTCWELIQLFKFIRLS